MLLVYDRVRAGGWRIGRDLWAADRASQLVEFAVALPLLVVFVVGIFDFSGAFTLKQKLTNAARDAARAAAAEPINDLCSSCGVPVSVTDAFWVVDGYLQANKINDCGITSAPSSSALPTWTFSVAGGSGGCPNTAPIAVKITINRGYYYPSTGAVSPTTLTCTSQAATGQTAVISTCVSIQYAYQWRFGQAASLLGSTPLLPPTINATAVAMNEN